MVHDIYLKQQNRKSSIEHVLLENQSKHLETLLLGAFFFFPFLPQNLFSLNQTLLKVRGKRAGKQRTLENLIGKQ